MAQSTADKLVLLGMDYPLATILGPARDNGTTINGPSLAYIGCPFPLAVELGNQINSHTYNADALIALGMPFPQAARLIQGADLQFAFNFKPGTTGNLTHWRTGRAAVLAKTGRALIIGAGDSNEVPAGAGNSDGAGTWTAAAAPFSKLKVMGDYLAATGVATNWQTVVGMMGLASIAALLAWDVRLTNMTSWQVGDLSIAQRLLQSASPNVDPLTFTPISTVTLDNYTTWFERGAGRGKFTVTDGGVSTTVDCTGATGFISASGVLNGRAAGKTITLNRTTFNANPVHIGATIFFDSLTPAVDLVNGGWYGAKTSDWNATTNAWSPLNALVAMVPHVVFLTLGANDLNTGVSITTLLANLDAMVAALVAAGIDVVLVHEASGQAPTWGTAQNQIDVLAGQQSIATTRNCVLMDEDVILGGFTVANANGDMRDGIHLSATGCAKVALARAQLLRVA